MTYHLGFWSYARLDDQDNAKLSWLRGRLEEELYALSGHRHALFQDQKDIAIGQDWDGRLHQGLADADFLMPIITPRFFSSEPCRAEVEAFVKREELAGTHDLILPIYWIDAPVLNDAARRSTDRIAQIIRQHQWDDWRSLRHASQSAPEISKAISALAAKTLSRYHEHRERTLNGAAITGEIKWPHREQHVSYRITTTGFISGLPPNVEIWTVVIAGDKLHPQTKLRADKTGAWRNQARIGSGTPNTSNGHVFRLQLVAVTDTTSSAFETYRKDSSKINRWSGVEPQQGCRLVHEVTLIRDDTTLDWRLEGTYDEFAPGPTGVTIMITPTSNPNNFQTAATNLTGAPRWAGTLHIDGDTPDVGSGTYGYNAATSDGVHTFQIDRGAGQIFVSGQDTKNSNGSQFHTTWRKTI